jgi:hypothetical protein
MRDSLPASAIAQNSDRGAPACVEIAGPRLKSTVRGAEGSLMPIDREMPAAWQEHARRRSAVQATPIVEQAPESYEASVSTSALPELARARHARRLRDEVAHDLPRVPPPPPPPGPSAA